MTTAEDVETARRLFCEYGRIPGIEICTVSLESEIRDLPRGYAAVLVGTVTGADRGCVALKKTGEGSAELKRLFVSVEARSTGLGRLLLKEAIVEARRMGFVKIWLETLPSMAQARRLYEAEGFIEVRRDGSGGAPEAIRMEMAL